MSALLDICASLTARATHVAPGARAMEIELSDGGNVFFLTDPERGGFCAGGITDNAAPELADLADADYDLADLALGPEGEQTTDPIEKKNNNNRRQAQ